MEGWLVQVGVGFCVMGMSVRMCNCVKEGVCDVYRGEFWVRYVGKTDD